MPWLIWNVRGVRRRETTDHLKAMINQNSITFIVLLEPMVGHAELSIFAFKIGFPNWAHGRDINSHIWVLWKPEWEVQHLAMSDQSITLRIQLSGGQSCIVSFVYASCLKRLRRDLWDHLTGIQHLANNTGCPWFVAGDFNTIANVSENQGGIDVDLNGVQEFQDFMEHNGLIDAGFHRSIYTWCNNRRGSERIQERLDKVMFNMDFQNLFPTARFLHLPRISSDHTPLCFEFQVPEKKKPSGFIFQNMWLDHPSFLHMVKKNWDTPIHGTPGYILARKWIRLKGALKDWNWNVFGNIHHKKVELRAKVHELD